MILESTFKPAWWLHNCHLQTLYPAFFHRVSLTTRRERINTADNDFLDLDWCDATSNSMVLFLHGLTGSAKSTYIQSLQKLLLQQKITSVALNFRGCSGEPNRLARGYHSGETTDLHFVYQLLRQRFPRRKLAIIGFSLGGNVLLKWLGEQGKQIDVQAAIAISVPYELAPCATKLDHGFSRIYRDNLLRDLKKHLQHKYHCLMHSGHPEEAKKLQCLGPLHDIKSFWQFDDRVVAKLHGFASAQHYYQVSSSRQYLKNINVPTLLLQAKDDPFMPAEVLPAASELAACIDFELANNGGHVGFATGNIPFKPHYWLEQRILTYLRQHHFMFKTNTEKLTANPTGDL